MLSNVFHDGCSNRFGTESVQAIATLVRLVPTLRSLSLRACDIRPSECADIAAALAENTAVTHLGVMSSLDRANHPDPSTDLRGNKVGDKGASSLAWALASSRLHELDLQVCVPPPQLE